MDDFSSERQGLLEQITASVRLPINGMTCQSCVRNIESNIGEKLGIITIKVDLQEKAGYVEYDPQLTDPRQIASDIDDMGFECVYIADCDDDEEIAAEIVQNNKPKILSTNIDVEGMTCQSCVKSIEQTIGSVAGIQTIKVSLEQKVAAVEYDGNLLNPQEIAEKISDMGFTADVQSDVRVKQLPSGL